MRKVSVVEGRSQLLLRGAGAVARIDGCVQGDRVAIVSGRYSFQRSSIRNRIVSSLSRHLVKEFSGWPESPTDNEAEQLAEQLSRLAPDVVMAVGGGSVLDIAKSARFLSARTAMFIAVPTTAGSGSEATPYASLR